MAARRIWLTNWRALSSTFPWQASTMPFIHMVASMDLASWRSRLRHTMSSWSFLRAACSTSSSFLSASTVSLRSLMRLRLGMSDCVGPSSLLDGPLCPELLASQPSAWVLGPLPVWGSAWEPRRSGNSSLSPMRRPTSRLERERTELGPSLLVYPASYSLWLPPASLPAGRPLPGA